MTPYLNRTGFFVMGFSNKSITPIDPFKPHICKREGLWRVSPYNWKKLWSTVGEGSWRKAHAYANRQNNLIREEAEAAKERQREFKRNEAAILVEAAIQNELFINGLEDYRK